MKVTCLSKVHTLDNSPENKKPLWFFLYSVFTPVNAYGHVQKLNY